MTKFLAIGMIGVTAILATATAQTGIMRQPASGGSVLAMQEMRETILRLEARIERLEGVAALESPSLFAETAEGTALAPAPKAPSAGRPAGPPRLVMKLDTVEPLDDDPEASEELDRLKNERDALQQTVDQMERKVTSLKGTRGGYSSARSYRSRRAPSRTGERRLDAETKLLSDYRRKLSKTNNEVRRLERQLDEPKQLIVGHWRSKIITLRTTSDVSRTLDRIDVGGYVTWEGRRIREDSDSQEWVVGSIERVDPEQVGARE